MKPRLIQLASLPEIAPAHNQIDPPTHQEGADEQRDFWSGGRPCEFYECPAGLRSQGIYQNIAKMLQLLCKIQHYVESGSKTVRHDEPKMGSTHTEMFFVMDVWAFKVSQVLTKFHHHHHRQHHHRRHFMYSFGPNGHSM